jgi:predicted nucleic acid-binding Zn ribbon protein
MSDPKVSDDLKPIGLTVYDLPQQTSNSLSESSRTRGGRMYMMLVLLACAAPVLLSYLTYYVIRPEGRVHHGDLIEPQRALPAVSAKDLQGQDRPLAQLKGQWLLVAVGSSECSDKCERLLFVQRQLHKLLNKESDRLDRVWLLTDQAEPKRELLSAIEGATLLRVPPDLLSQWLTPASGRSVDEHLYLIDPMGNWMMRFNYPDDAKTVVDMKRDIERLLRASSSWDKPGR